MKLLRQTIVVLFLITLALKRSDSKNIDKELETFKKVNLIVVAKDGEPCETACERPKMYCNFHDYKSLSQEAINKLTVDTLIGAKELRITHNSSCKNEKFSDSILSSDDKFSNESAELPLPVYSENNTCVYGYIRSNPSWDLPCDASGKNYRILCTCRNQGIEFENEHRIILSEKLQNCEETCQKQHFTCSFDAYSKLSQYQIRHLLKNAAISSTRWNASSSCTKSGNMFTGSIADMHQSDDLPPFISSTSMCILGYMRTKSTPIPKCDIYFKTNKTIFFCFCVKQDLDLQQWIKFSKEYKNCDQTCEDQNLKCSFDAYSKLTQHEIRKRLENAVKSSGRWEGKDSCSDGNIFTINSHSVNQLESYPPLVTSTEMCINRYLRNTSTPVPNCTTLYVDKTKSDYFQFCSCRMQPPTTAAAIAPTSTTLIGPISGENTKSDGDESSKRKDEAKDDKSLHKLAIAAIVIFVLGLCLIILGVALFLINRAKKNKETGGQKSTQHDAAPKSVISATTKGKSGVDEVSRTAGKSVQMTRSSNQRKSVKKTLGLTSKTSAPKSLK